MDATLGYTPLGGNRHRHGAEVHSHPHDGPHVHGAAHEHDHSDGEDHHHHGHEEHHHHHGGHGHSHGLIDPSIKRSREGLIAVGLSLAVLGFAALVQLAIFLLSGSVALLADLIHNFGDAATAIPLAIAFLLRSERAERIAGLFVVFAIFVSACVAGVESISRLIHPQTPTNLIALAAAGLIGFSANWLAAQIRTKAGHRLDSPALIADGNHARVDGFVSLGVVGSALVVALGVPIADPIIGLVITTVILKITWDSWQTIYGGSL